LRQGRDNRTAAINFTLMTIRIVAFLCALSLGIACAAAVSADSAKRAGCTRLVLTGHPSYPPVAWAAGGTLEGAGIALVRRLAKDADIPIVVVNKGSWAAAQQAVRGGKADAIVGIYLTQERAKFLDYVRPAFAPDPSAVLVRANEHFVYKNWNSLIGKHGAVSAGEVYGARFDAFMHAKLTVRRVNGFAAVYQTIIDKEADYGLAGYYPALTGAPKGKLKIVEPNFVTEGLYLAFGKSSPCSSKLSARFSKDVARLIADGTVKRLMATALSNYLASPR